MLLIQTIEQAYPEKLRPYRRFILREYLQYKILDMIYGSEYGSRLSFIGDTALRLLYGNQRFSEDLDFDNLGLSFSELKDLTSIIQKQLSDEGYTVFIRNTQHNAFRCRIKIPELLYENQLSPLKEEEILIQFDTEPQHYPHDLENQLLNQFDVLTYVKSSPLSVLYSQKLYAAFHRKRAKGRDFFDILFLSNRTSPDFGYLDLKLKIKDMGMLKSHLMEGCSQVNFSDLAKDVQPFLFNPMDVKKVALFPEWVASLPAG